MCASLGKDDFEWFHNPRVSWSMDPARQEPGNGVSSGGGANSGEGGASRSRGLLLWQPLHKVHVHVYLHVQYESFF